MAEKKKDWINIARTVVTLGITPPALSLCLFFAVNFYNDAQDGKKVQTEILVALGEIKSMNHNNTVEIKEVKKHHRDDIKEVEGVLATLNKEILEIYKR